MFDILLNWIYVICIMIIIGWSISNIISKYLHFDFKTIDYYILFGIVCTITYAQIFSLFYKVSLLANSLLLAICLLCIIIQRKRLSFCLKNIPNHIHILYRSNVHSSICKLIISLLLLFLFLFVTSRGAEHYDTQLYQLTLYYQYLTILPHS